MNDKQFNLKDLRTGLGLTQKQMAEAARLSNEHFSALEKNKHEPHISTAWAICKVLNEGYGRKGPDLIRPYHIWPRFFGDPFA